MTIVQLSARQTIADRGTGSWLRAGSVINLCAAQHNGSVTPRSSFGDKGNTGNLMDPLT